MSHQTNDDACHSFLNDEFLFYEALKRMDEQAFRCLYKRVYEYCIHYVQQHNGSAEEALDHLQTTLEQFIINIRRGAYAFQPETKVTTYFIQVFRLSWLKYITRRPQSTQSLHAFDSTNELSHELTIHTITDDDSANLALVRQAMERLSPQCQQLIELFYAEDLSIAQLAVRMQLTAESAKNQLYRCRNYLKVQYRQLTRLYA